MNGKITCALVGLCFGMLAWAAGPIKIITTTQDPAAIARAVGGEWVTVESLTMGTRDPHYAEAKPSMIRQVSRADLLLTIGAELEIGWLPALLGSARNKKIQPGESGYLDLSAAVTLRGVPTGPVSRAMGDVHLLGNPHYWLDPRNGVAMARAIASRLSQLDPAHSAGFQTNLAAFETEIDAKFVQWSSRLAFLRKHPTISYHSSFLYLENAFGFEIVAQIEPKPGIAPSASHLNELVAQIKSQGIPLIILEPYYDRRPAEFLSKQTGIRVAVLPQSVGAFPNIRTYPDLFDAIAQVLESVWEGSHE